MAGFFTRGVARRALRRRAVLALLAVIAVAAPLAQAEPASAFQEDVVVQLVNESRWADGKPGLLRNAEMDRVALAWAEQLAASGTLSHNPDYASQIPSGWERAGENVASGYADAYAMHRGWMDSAGHRANILGDYTDIGVALVEGSGSTWGVQVFARYPGHVGPAPPPAAQPAPPAEAPPVEEAPPADVPAAPVPTVTPSPGPTATASRAAPAPTATPEAPASTGGPAPWAGPVIVAVVLALVLAGAAGTWLVMSRRRRRPAGGVAEERSDT